MAAEDHGMTIHKQYLSDIEKTFQLEESLPSLPVPRLEHTLARYLDSVKPHLTEDEFKHTKEVVQRFSTGVGSDLHRRLVESANHSRNWLEDWWEKYAYLSLRSPHAPFVNFGGPIPVPVDKWPPKLGTQCERAALITLGIVQFWQILRKQQLPIERGGRTTVWSMNQFHMMYNSCKVPGETIDSVYRGFKTESRGNCPGNVVVLCMGRYFTFNVLDSNNRILSAPEIEQILKTIRSLCDKGGYGSTVGALTAEQRTTWHQLRNHLISIHPENERSLLNIQNSIFMVVLDERSPDSIYKVQEESLFGDARNRWLDKSVSMIIFKNGLVGTNMDHSACDGMVNIVQSHFVLKLLEENNYQWKGSRSVRKTLCVPEELLFHVDGYIRQAVGEAVELYERGCSSMELKCRDFTDFGKNFLRDCKVKPDTFMQMALHYGYYRLHGRAAPGYETASTRKFYHGRTETLRSCTPEVVDWCRAMQDGNASTRRRLQLFKIAMDKHDALMAEAVDNQGCDRHLFGLQIIAMEQGLPLPELYSDPAYTKSGGGGNFILSTSCTGYNAIIGACAPMCKDGYGCFYGFDLHRMLIVVGRWIADDTSSAKMSNSVVQSLRDMKQLLLHSNDSKL